MLILTLDKEARVTIVCPDGSKGEIVLRELKPGRASVGFEFPHTWDIIRDNAKRKFKMAGK